MFVVIIPGPMTSPKVEKEFRFRWQLDVGPSLGTQGKVAGVHFATLPRRGGWNNPLNRFSKVFKAAGIEHSKIQFYKRKY